jgi:hypothetical protein
MIIYILCLLIETQNGNFGLISYDIVPQLIVVIVTEDAVKFVVSARARTVVVMLGIVFAFHVVVLQGSIMLILAVYESV